MVTLNGSLDLISEAVVNQTFWQTDCFIFNHRYQSQHNIDKRC